MESILDLIFPPKCVFCENYGALICESCLQTCRRLRHFYTLSSQTVPISLTVFCYFVYENKIRECIKYSKYSKRQFAVLREVTKWAVLDMLQHKVEFPAGCNYVVPIPLSTTKQRERGFNQAEIIADTLSKGYGFSNQKSILYRQKETISQHRLNKEERLKNMKSAFAVSVPVKDCKFILIDDICTTGATLLEAADALYKAGAVQIVAFTLSKRL